MHVWVGRVIRLSLMYFLQEIIVRLLGHQLRESHADCRVSLTETALTWVPHWIPTFQMEMGGLTMSHRSKSASSRSRRDRASLESTMLPENKYNQTELSEQFVGILNKIII